MGGRRPSHKAERWFPPAGMAANCGHQRGARPPAAARPGRGSRCRTSRARSGLRPPPAPRRAHPAARAPPRPARARLPARPPAAAARRCAAAAPSRGRGGCGTARRAARARGRGRVFPLVSARRAPSPRGCRGLQRRWAGPLLPVPPPARLEKAMNCSPAANLFPKPRHAPLPRRATRGRRPHLDSARTRTDPQPFCHKQLGDRRAQLGKVAVPGTSMNSVSPPADPSGSKFSFCH